MMYDDIDFGALGVTPLHFAACENDVPLVKQLLSYGFDINVKDKLNLTPLKYIVSGNERESHFEILEFLLENGADANAHKSRGTPLLYELVEKGNIRIIQLFLKFHPNFNVQNEDGRTVLFSAAESNDDVDVIRFLIDLGLDVNHQDKRQTTPLHLACRSAYKSIKNMKIIKLLLQKGADTNVVFDYIVNNYRASPLQLAIGGFKMHNGNDKDLMKKCLNFLMDHTDFSLINDECSDEIFGSTPSYCSYSWKLVLEHVAKLQSLNVLVIPTLLDLIPTKEEYKNYYAECEEELLRAKNTKFENSWVNFYNLLVDGRKKLKNYAGNSDLIKQFKKSKCTEKFPIYGNSMKKNVKNGIKRRKLFDKSSFVLSKCLPIFKPNHLILRDIFNCILSKKDLSKFCN